MDQWIKPVFCATVPAELEQGKVYVSIECKIAVHKCCCGCGAKVHTPLTPRDWEIVYNGKELSLYPSIGGWRAACRSHYIISENRVINGRWMDEEEIEQGRKKRKMGGRSMTAAATGKWRRLLGSSRT